MANDVKYTSQYVDNIEHNETLKAKAVVGLGYDGVNTQVPLGESLAVKVTEDSGYTYVGVAAPGTAQATAKWQCKRVDETTVGTTIVEFADGDADFDNVATDLTALSYS